MKKIIRIIVIISIFIAFVIISLSAYIQIDGRKRVVSILENALGQKISIDDVRYIVPVGLIIKNVKLGEDLSAKEVKAQFSLLSIIQQQLIITQLTLIEPKINLTRGQPFLINNKNIEEDQKQNPSSQTSDYKEDKETQLTINQLVINNGRLSYKRPTPFRDLLLTFDEMNLKADFLKWPLQSNETTFEVSAIMREDTGIMKESDLRTSGTINFVDKNLDADLYLSRHDDQITLEAKLVSINNDLDVKGHLQIKSAILDSAQDTKDSRSLIDQMILRKILVGGLDMGLDFTIKTKMDDFKIEDIEFSGEVGGQVKSEEAVAP